MNIFLDIEFTNQIDCDLISIGLVAEDGREFYGERSDFDVVGCSDFTRSIVLPLLGQDLGAVYSTANLRTAVLGWLHQYIKAKPVICSDAEIDQQLLCNLLGDSDPRWLKETMIWNEIDELALEEFWRSSHLTPYHALYDARANRFAFRSKRK